MATTKKTATKKAASKQASKPKNVEPALMELFIDEIKDIYWAEKHLVKTLPKMSKAATSGQLAASINDHLEITKTQVARLEQVFELLGKKPIGKKCEAMEGLAEEGKGVIEDTEAGSATRDVGIIIASQKVEHYEIATYGCLTQIAKVLGLNDVADILAETLAEEKEADELLTTIAENDINYEAAEEEE